MELQKKQAETPAPTSQPAMTPATEKMLDRDLGPYRVGSGDVLAIGIYGVEMLTGPLAPIQVRINRNGAVELPGVGPVQVAGMDLLDVQEALHSALVPKVYQDVVVHVALVEPEVTRVLVHGAVLTPGLVPLRRAERNLLFAIVAAGGVTQGASGQVTIRRLRHPEQSITLDLLSPDQLRAALSLEPLKDGDIISVTAATPNTIFVGGLVLAPHAQAYPPGTSITVLQAIAASGGLRTDVTPHHATLIRRGPDGRDAHVKLNMDRIGTGKDPNLTLVAGDVLWVPETVETKVEDWINRNIFIRAGASATFGANYNMQGIDFLNSAARQTSVSGSSGGLQDQFDPFGFLLRNQALQGIQQTVATPP